MSGPELAAGSQDYGAEAARDVQKGVPGLAAPDTQRRDERGHQRGRVFHFVYDATRDEVRALNRLEFGDDRLTESSHTDLLRARERIEAALQDAVMQWLPDRQSRAGLQVSLTGVCVC